MSAISDFSVVCEKAVKSAGATVQAWTGKTSTRLKGPADLVTEADFASQEVIRKAVLDAFPDHSFLGEEGALAGTGGADSYRWIADPLDGTTNYVHAIPHYCVSLALEQGGRVVVGAIYDPTRDECFTAADGQGAHLNGRRLHTSTVSRLSDAIGATGFPANVTRDSLDVRVFNEAVYHLQGARRMGSAALNLCYLAAGRFDVLWGFSTKIWDVAAGTLIAREAGAVLTSPEGGDFILEHARYIAAANAPLHAALKEVVDRCVDLGAGDTRR
jgi:myo-inositol-1(or 4)-monophosphatase